MTTTILTPAGGFQPRAFGLVPELVRRLVASFAWARDVSRGLKSLGRAVDDQAVRQILAEADARNGLLP